MESPHIGVVVSRADAVSERIGDHLLALDDWTERRDDVRPDGDGGGTVYRADGVEVRSFDDLHLELVDVAAAFDEPGVVVFVSRHAGDSGPLLTAHFTGNFGAADHGGSPRELAAAAPPAAKRALSALETHAPEGYDTSLECTHHGPSSVGAPSLFVELGSGEPQWTDDDAARAVARAVLDLRGVAPRTERTLVAFGGGHYAPRATRLVRETGWAVGHVGADWCLDALGDPRAGRDVVDRAFAASGAERAVVEGDRPELAETIRDLGYDVVSETWARAADGVPLSLVDRLEERLCTVDDGLRFGDPARAADPDVGVRVTDLPDDLVEAVAAVSLDHAREAVARTALAYETRESGNRVTGRVAVPEGGTDDLVDALCGVLAEAYDAVDHRDGTVVARRTVFDPAAARERGVEPGPSFGRLAAGETVTVDGEPVTPDDVHREETHRFSV